MRERLLEGRKGRGLDSKDSFFSTTMTTTKKILDVQGFYGLKTFNEGDLTSRLHHTLNEQLGTAITLNKNKQASAFTTASAHSFRASGSFPHYSLVKRPCIKSTIQPCLTDVSELFSNFKQHKRVKK